MNEEQQAAYINAQAAVLMGRIAGMQAENKIQELQGLSIAYDEKAFQVVIDESGCHHNAVIGLFHSR